MLGDFVDEEDRHDPRNYILIHKMNEIWRRNRLLAMGLILFIFVGLAAIIFLVMFLIVDRSQRYEQLESYNDGEYYPAFIALRKFQEVLVGIT